MPAADVGLAQDDVEAIWRAVTAFYRHRLHPALSICVRYRGAIVLDRAIGHARGNGPTDPAGTALVAATPNTLFNFFSGSKAVSAMLIHHLAERGLVHIDEPVATFVPEFARHGKGRITLRDVLSHRAGIPATPTEAIDLDLLADDAAVLEAVCELRPESAPGELQAYHAITGGFVFAEVIRRVTGKDARQLMNDVVCEPLGFRHLNFGVGADELDQVALEAFTGPPPRFPVSQLLERSLGAGMEEVVRIANDARFRTAIVPSGNVIGTANEVCRFFELLRQGGELDGVRVFEPRTIRRAVHEEARGELDRVLMLPLRYGLGFMLGGERVSFYGPGTPRAFGHLGFTNVLGWADPERELSVGLMNNGKPLFSVRFVAWLNIMRVIAQRFPRAPLRGA